MMHPVVRVGDTDAIKICDALHDGKSQPCGVRFLVVGLIEAGEKAGIIQRFSFATVGNGDLIRKYADHNFAVYRSVYHGIFEQVCHEGIG